VRPLSTTLLFVIAMLASGCGPSESTKRIQSLTNRDFERLHAVAVTLCASYESVRQNDAADLSSDGKVLFEPDIPRELAFFSPQAVRFTDSWAIIYLYKTPAGEDSITIGRNEDGIWTIRTHTGDWMNPESPVIWTSEKESNQAMQRIRSSAPDSAYETSLAGPSSLI
jgi:hypothetical protein